MTTSYIKSFTHHSIPCKVIVELGDPCLIRSYLDGVVQGEAVAATLDELEGVVGTQERLLQHAAERWKPAPASDPIAAKLLAMGFSEYNAGE